MWKRQLMCVAVMLAVLVTGVSLIGKGTHEIHRRNEQRRTLPPPPQPSPSLPGIDTRSTITLGALADAICAVESGGRSDVIGDSGLAVGAFQIHPIMVDDVNRILGRREFTLYDRWSKERSRQTFLVFATHYGRGKSAEWIARAWNGSPRWEHKSASVKANTARYWSKVQGQLQAVTGIHATINVRTNK